MTSTILRFAALALVAGWATSRVHAQPQPGTPQPPANPAAKPADPAAAEAGVHVEARGPIHEAFARPWEPVVNPTAIIHKEAPAPIPEEPPAERPAGKNVQWIPGYWQWDDDRKDFTWISGAWRDVPEGRRWVVGHWTTVADGWYRVPGHWAAQQEPDFQYVTKPPEPKAEEQPPAPDENSIWIPGSWFYTDSGWQWRTGYYTEAQAGQVWQPASYDWSPNGYIYSSGYWDYDPFNRGLLFAPVWFDRPLWRTAGWSYRPFYAVNLALAWTSLFVRPGWGYYYGDWYGRGYAGLGFRPWYSYGAGRYDPLFAYQRWNYRSNPAFFNNIRTVNEARINGTAALPSRTLVARTTGTGAAAGGTLVVPLNQFRTANANMRLEAVTPQQRATFSQNAQLMHEHSRNLSEGNFPAHFTTNLNAGAGVSNSFHSGTFQPGAPPRTGFQQVAPIHSSFPGYHPSAGGAGAHHK
jgi:hypothetical protein